MNWKKYYEAHTKRCIHHAKWLMDGGDTHSLFGKYLNNLKILIKCFRKDVIPFMDLSVGTFCTLRCEDCSQWNPYLKNKSWYKLDDIIKNMEHMLATVNYIFGVGVIGGEPLAYKYLDKVLEYLCNNKQIGYVLLVTNGTLYPSDNVIHWMKNPKVTTWVSCYAAIDESEARKQLISLLEDKKQGIKHAVFNEMVWKDMGRLSDKPNKFSLEAVKKNFDSCWLKDCCAFMDGVLYRCTRSYGIVNCERMQLKNSDECIDFHEIKTKRDLEEKMKAFYGSEYLKACYWCNDIKHRKDIKAGVQIK